VIIETGVTPMEEPDVNVGAAERGVSVTVGVALLAFAAARRRPFSSLLMAAAGAWLTHRGVTGRCVVYDQLDVGTVEDDDEQRLDAGPHDDLSVETAITIGRPVREVYAFWRGMENFPLFMKNILSVTERGGGRSSWVARGPAGRTWHWESEILEDRPGELLVWRSRPGSEVHHHGAVRFQEAPAGRGTELRVGIEFLPPGGIAGRVVARLARRAPEHEVEEDLRRLKQVMEAGETPIAGYPRGPADHERDAEDDEDPIGGAAGA
jgi:uncharacterized membrane protein